MNWWVLKRKIHISWLIAISCLCFSLGVYFSSLYTLSDLSILLIGLMLLSIGMHSKKIVFLIFVIIGSLLIGVYRGSVSAIEIYNAKEYYGKIIQIEGVIIDDVDINNSGKSIIMLKAT